MEPIADHKQVLKRFPDSEFEMNLYSWLMTFFLCVVWPLGIILKFTLSDRTDNIEDFSPLISFYLPTIITQLIILFLIYLVIKKEEVGFKSVGLGKFKLVYIADAILFQVTAWYILGLVSSFLVKLEFIEFYDTAPLLPQSAFEFGIFLVLCVVAAVAEETAFRGYLISRLTRISRSRVLAVFLATLAFSAGHIYQGTGGFILVFLYGLMCAVLYFITRSLWPCVIAHFIHNAAKPVLSHFFQ